MNHSIAILLLFSLALQAQVPLDESGMEGTLEIVFVDAFGIPVDARAAKVSVQQFTNGNLGPLQHIGLRPVLKYGTYKLGVLASPAYPVDKIVRINKRHVTASMPKWGNSGLPRGRQWTIWD